MVDSAFETEVIAASADKCFGVAIDVERYPEWAPDIKEAVVRERDSQNRPVLVEYRASALGRSTHYTLKYDYANAPQQITWHLSQGDIMRSIEGSYKFEQSDANTKVTYSLAVELIVPLPGFIKRRAEGRILNTLKELKVRCES
ncbi:MAG: SRPBCC family protein [Actinomycetota bacterium]|nr:SRPBCC family protein [Actinomycetota bacterium]MDA3004605.1 SRPBCC family protein [Actinomycetota bacterium]